MKRILLICLIAQLTGWLNRSYAQSIAVGSVFDDYQRTMQLIGKADTNISLTIRPVIYPRTVKDVFDPDSSRNTTGWTGLPPISFADGKGRLQLLPFTWKQQFNSNHPYGGNDGAMIPAKGYQTMISGGFYISYGALSVQFMPEYVYATNPAFNGFASINRPDQDLVGYYFYHNEIDQPERFGNAAYKQFFLGQSSIRFTFGPVSFGLSNENIWWGPGVKNALILSNNAPGFKHATFNTVRPVKTPVGSFEWQVIAGRLDGSGLPPLSVTGLPDGTNLFAPKINDWRYFTGFNINYQPNFIPHLTLGLTRTFNAYKQNVSGFNGYVPFFTPYQKKNTNDGDIFPRDQYTSFYGRWLFPKAQAEIYFEYGLNDNAYNLTDFFQSPEHSRAYIWGLRKMLKLNKRQNQYILLSTEITQMSQTVDRSVRESGGWYTHGIVRDGHTNKGQVLGAASGSGGNHQSAEVSWLSGLNELGFVVERYEHDVDFYQKYLPDFNGNSRNWVDIAMGFKGRLTYKNLIFNAKLQGIKSLNYQWILKDYVAGQYYIPHNDVYNFHGELGVTLRF
jgi:hypothetical protein